VDADGSGARALTSGRQCDSNPTWSPAGDSLVFTRRVALRGPALAVALYVMRADGSGQARLTQRALTGARLKRVRNWAVDSSPSWSSGGLIAFARGTATVNDTIFVVRPGGSGLRRLTRRSASASHLEPSWSPDGGTLAFTKRFRGPAGLDQVFLIESDGTGERTLSEDVAGINSAPAWSPDGSYVCLRIGASDATYSFRLVVVERDGSFVRPLDDTRGADVPDWQPLPS
jgi:Tol biopolymer transport system component